jgi:hypothetical protein
VAILMICSLAVDRHAIRVQLVGVEYLDSSLALNLFRVDANRLLASE